LKEGEIYTFTVKNDDNIFYKDLIYIGTNPFDYIWSLIDEDWDATEKEFIDAQTSKKTYLPCLTITMNTMQAKQNT
jgi:hypothetical protein